MIAGTTVKRSKKRELPRQATPVRIGSAAAVGSVLTVVFDQPVVLKGTPQYSVDVAGADPVSASMTFPNTLALTYDAAIAAATEITIPFEDPAIRSAVGGFVADSTFKI
jgi:hypothetical protein